jgi:hypothetical protein
MVPNEPRRWMSPHALASREYAHPLDRALLIDGRSDWIMADDLERQRQAEEARRRAEEARKFREAQEQERSGRDVVKNLLGDDDERNPKPGSDDE